MRHVIGSRRLSFTDFNGKRRAIRKRLKRLEVAPVVHRANLADMVNVVNVVKLAGL